MPMLRKNRDVQPESNGNGRQGDRTAEYDPEPYSRRPIGDPYSRSDRRVEDDRNELFSGYKPEKARGNRFVDGPSLGREPPPGEENDEDVEGIKQQTRFIKQESVNSTRNALRLAREAEDSAKATIGRLGEQSEMLANTERHLDLSKGHADRASDRADELKQLNRSTFRPVITWNKDAKRAKQEAKIQARGDEEREARETAMKDIRDTKNRLGSMGDYGDEEGIGGMGRGRSKTGQEQEQRKQQRKRFQFEETASDDEIEDEIDDNLDELSSATKRLHSLGLAMGTELTEQNQRIQRIEKKATNVGMKVERNTDRLLKIK